jgi:DNA replication and repair protein RecF
MLKYLYLQNFRNYRHLEFKPDAGFLILTGANGTGKSNLLESIYYLGTGYSFRQGRDNNLMRFGSGYFLIRGIVNRKGIDYKIEVIYREDLGHKLPQTHILFRFFPAFDYTLAKYDIKKQGIGR